MSWRNTASYRAVILYIISMPKTILFIKDCLFDGNFADNTGQLFYLWGKDTNIKSKILAKNTNYTSLYKKFPYTEGGIYNIE